jgi:hypothetical protein
MGKKLIKFYQIIVNLEIWWYNSNNGNWFFCEGLEFLLTEMYSKHLETKFPC